MRLRATLVAVAALGIWGTPVGTWAQSAPEAPSIVGIVDVAAGRGEALSTGFVISSDGTVMTTSHVVSHVKEDPAHHSLLVLYEGANGREFFGADLLCATTLHAIPDPSGNVLAEKDAALVRITPYQGVARRFGYPLPGGQRYDWVRHEGPLPEFPALHIAGEPK